MTRRITLACLMPAAAGRTLHSAADPATPPAPKTVVKTVAADINQFMLHKAEWTQDGGLSHFNGKPQLWVDTLDMCCPVFSHSARIKNDPNLQQEAVRQQKIFAKHLQDPKTGLLYHMWDERSGKHTPAFWARGNGWVALSYTEVLKHEKPTSESRARLTAASAMFLYALAECRSQKLLDLPDKPYLSAMHRAWRGLATQVAPTGRVVGISAGTGPSEKEGYLRRKRGTYTWGTGAHLLAACAYAECRDSGHLSPMPQRDAIGKDGL